MPIPAQVWNRMMHIRNPRTGATGSAFAVEVDGNEYICSARHIFDGAIPDAIEVRFDRSWVLMPVQLVGVGVGEDDVIVLRSIGFRRVASGSLPVLMSRDKMIITQEAFVLGYPFGWESYPKETSDKWPFAIVKHAIITGLPTDDHPRKLLLDCQINPGFSGGPVAVNILGTLDWAFVGVIAAEHRENFYDKEGHLVAHVPIDFSVATDIQCVTNLIAGHPSGAPVE